MRRVALTVLLSVMLILAGCNSAPGGGNQPPSTVANDTTTETPIEGEYPPGLSASGVTDAEAFAAAHEESLANRSYTYTREATVTAVNGSQLGNWTEYAQVGPERLRFNNTQTGTGVNVAGHAIDDIRIYTNGSVTLIDADGSDDYRRKAGRGFAANTFSSASFLVDAFNTTETSVTTVERDGQTWYRVTAAPENETFTYRYPDETVEIRATDLSTTALVSPSGLVTNFTHEYDFERGSVSGHRTMEIRYSAVGETTVERPSWYDEAINVTSERRDE